MAHRTKTDTHTLRPNPLPAKLSGDKTVSGTLAERLAQWLSAQGVRHAFGMPGGVLLGLVDAFRRFGIDFVLVRHEGSAGFMADACAQLTGSPGVCVGTLGPGVTNLVSPVAGAHLERSPVVAITGQIQTDLLGTYTHQILDHVALFEPITRAATLLTRDGAREQISEALGALRRDVPGPVLIDVPAELWSMPLEPLDVDTPALAERVDAAAAVARLQDAHRPVLVVGHLQLTDAVAQAVTTLAERLQAPVVTTYRAKGAISDAHPLCAGAFGLSPVVDHHQQALIGRADVLVAIGLDPVELRPQWLPGWSPDLPMVRVGSSRDIPHPCTHDLGDHVLSGLDAINSSLGAVSSQWRETEVEAHNEAWSAPFDDGPDGPATTIRAVQEAMGPDALCSMDVGAHRITASHVWRCTKPWAQLQSNGFSSMGTGLPGAIAARLVHPDRPVVALTGDMGLWMTLGELGIVQERGLDLVVVYLADQSLSLIELKQERIPLPNHGVRFDNPSVGALAAAFGGVGHEVRGAEPVARAVRAAVESGGLHLIEASINAERYREQM